MEKDTSFKIIYWLSLLGILFSGYLSYSELVNKVCALGSCPIVAGIPACVYGFVMFVIIFVLSVVGFKAKK